MKKTLISLAVAVSAIASGSAMAWQANGKGGDFEMGGALTPVDIQTPWEVKTGAAVSGLDAQIKKGQEDAVIPVNHSIPVLAIRTQTKEPFHGDADFAPQIDFHDALDIDNFFDTAVVPVVLDVKSPAGKRIGSMMFNMLAVGVSSYKTPDQGGANTVMIAPNAGDGFYGGLGKSLKGTDGLIPRIQNIFGSELAANYTDQGTGSRAPARETFNDKNATFSGYYGAGVEAGQSIKLSLDQKAADDEPIKWHASLPVTVSYP
ncbi:hypothetical protein AB0378_004253 [Salmonella enterica]